VWAETKAQKKAPPIAEIQPAGSASLEDRLFSERLIGRSNRKAFPVDQMTLGRPGFVP